VGLGTRSFVVRGDSYAHAGSAVMAAAENPANPRYSVVVIAGLSAEATLKAAPGLARRDGRAAEVVVAPNSGRSRAVVIPASDMVLELGTR
jgi:hypothetical protein